MTEVEERAVHAALAQYAAATGDPIVTRIVAEMDIRARLADAPAPASSAGERPYPARESEARAAEAARLHATWGLDAVASVEPE